MNVLITSAGRRVSLVRAFSKEIKLYGKENKVFAADFEPDLSAACQVADSYFKVPLIADPNYIEELLRVCIENSVKLVIPTIDTELRCLANSKEKFLEHDIHIIISDLNFVEQCRNKRLIHCFLVDNSINIAKEYLKNDYKLPLFIKPIDGSRSVDTYIVKVESDLKPYHFKNDKLMFLEYLDHDIYEEFTCDMYYDKNSELKCVVPRKRIEVRDGEVYKALTENNSLVPYIKKHLNKIEGAIGCITAQFFLHKEDSSKIYAIEINPRFGGGYPLSYLAGANFPKWIIDEYLFNKSIEDKFDAWEKNLLMIRYDHEVLVHGYKG